MIKSIKKHGLRNLLAVLLIYSVTSLSAFATKLPDKIVGTIKKELPKSSIRFDGLISMPDGTIYLPVLPSNPKRNDEGKVVSTYPSGKKLSQLPDVVLFDSNFALLKVIKEKDAGACFSGRYENNAG